MDIILNHLHFRSLGVESLLKRDQKALDVRATVVEVKRENSEISCSTMRILKPICIITIILFALPLHAAFTADLRVVSGGKTKESVFYFAGDKWRMNENTPQGKRATIFRADNKTITILWPDNKFYITQPVPEKEYKMLATLKPGEELERTELGREKVSGYPTIKYRVKYLLRNKQFTYIEWYSKDLGFVIKSQAEDNSRTAELTNIKKVKLDKNIFEATAVPTLA